MVGEGVERGKDATLAKMATGGDDDDDVTKVSLNANGIGESP